MECKQVDQTGAVGEHLGQGRLPDAGLHELAPSQEPPRLPVHLFEDLSRSGARTRTCLLWAEHSRGSDDLEDGTCDLRHLLRLDQAVVVYVEESEGPGELLLLAALRDDVERQDVLPEVHHAVTVQVEGAEDMAAEVVCAVVGEEYAVPGEERVKGITCQDYLQEDCLMPILTYH